MSWRINAVVFWSFVGFAVAFLAAVAVAFRGMEHMSVNYNDGIGYANPLGPLALVGAMILFGLISAFITEWAARR